MDEAAQSLAWGLHEYRTRMYEHGRGASPEVISALVSKATKTSKPRTRYVAGAYAKPMIFIRKWFGDRMIMSQMR